jgi:tetrahydromethanopterin S-methyltransferase subunit D
MRPSSSRALDVSDLSATTAGRRPFETPLLLVGVRCAVRYIVLPLVLPLLGVAARPALGILVILDVIAVVAIVTTLHRLWRHRHPRRWQYLPVAVILTTLIALLLVNDGRLLSA